MLSTPPIDAEGARVANDPSEPSVLLRGLVEDEVTHAPLLAIVIGPNEQAVLTDASNGVFEIETGGPGEWTVAAPHYETIRERDPGPDWLVRLHPTSTSALRISSTPGIPASGISVEWRALSSVGDGAIDDQVSSAERSRGAAIDSLTNRDGISAILCGTPMLATPILDSGRTVPGVVVFPGEQRALELPAEWRTIRFVEGGTKQRVAGLAIEVLWPAEARPMSRVVQTDSDGTVRLPRASGVTYLRLARDVGAADLVPAERAGVTGDSIPDVASTVEIEPWAGVDPIEVALHRHTTALRLVNRVTQAPVDGPALVTVRFAKDRPDRKTALARSPRISGHYADRVVEVRQGVLLVGRSMQSGLRSRLERAGERGLELVVSVAGYAPVVVGLPEMDDASELDGMSIELDRAQERRVRIEDASGAPVSLRVTVTDDLASVRLLESDGEAEGVYGPFDWCSGAVTLEAGDDRWTVTGAELAASSILTKRLLKVGGSIRVVDIPLPQLATRLVAMPIGTRNSQVRKPAHITVSTCSFEGLEAGRYVVGPGDWVAGVSANSARRSGKLDASLDSLADAVIVQAGEESEVRWREQWSAAEPISGRVIVEGPAASEAFLLPVYVDALASLSDIQGATIDLAISNRDRPVRWDASGNYLIDSGEPVPSAIALCFRQGYEWGSGNDFFVVNLIAPGDSLTIGSASLLVNWAGETDGDAHSLVVTIPSRDPGELVQLRPWMLQSRRTWARQGPLYIPALPATSCLIETAGLEEPMQVSLSQGGSVEVSLKPGEHQ